MDVALRAITFARRDEFSLVDSREADAALVSFVRSLGRGRCGLAPRRWAAAAELLALYRLPRLVPLTPFVAGQLLAHLLHPLAHGLRRRGAPGPFWDRIAHRHGLCSVVLSAKKLLPWLLS